ncbi:MAG: NTP transferase domain-containing protein [Alphaproteobacteria bacterium]|nr:NTP transferase domain-containing protein [Alphaproteobacteria bacterium]
MEKHHKKYKGILLAGGHGTRLYPITKFSCKQLLPIYDKPLIYYALTLLLLAKIEEILIISTPTSIPIIEKVLGDGSQYGIKISYQVQAEPKGIAQAFLLAEEFLAGSPCMMVLGDNIINKSGIADFFSDAMRNNDGATIFGFPVRDPQRFGIVELDANNKILSVEEKPQNPKSNIAAIGLYLYDETVVEKAHRLTPSVRGELEITDLNALYLQENRLHCQILSRGDFWVDAGTFDSMNDASNYIRLQQKYTNLAIGAPMEAAYSAGFITQEQMQKQT